MYLKGFFLNQVDGLIFGFYNQTDIPLYSANISEHTYIDCFKPVNFSWKFIIFNNNSDYARLFDNFTSHMFRQFELLALDPLDKFYFTEYYISQLERINSPYMAFAGKNESSYPTNLNILFNRETDSRDAVPLQVINDCNLNTLTYNEFFMNSGNCTYEYRKGGANMENYKDIKSNPRLCLLIQEFPPDVKLILVFRYLKLFFKEP